MTATSEGSAATPGAEYAARYEAAVVALRAVCAPEDFEGAMAEAKHRQNTRGLGPVAAVESMYEDVAMGWRPDGT